MVSDMRFCILMILYGSIALFYGNEVMRQRSQKTYEIQFLYRHLDTIRGMRGDDFLPLTFPHRETEHMLSLCKQYRSAFMNRLRPISTEPSRQIHYIGFRRQKQLYNPVRIEVIRCSESIALIEAGDGVWGYVLSKYEPIEKISLGFTLFNIHGKFKYTLEDPPANEGLQLLLGREGERRENQPSENDHQD